MQTAPSVINKAGPALSPPKTVALGAIDQVAERSPSSGRVVSSSGGKGAPLPSEVYAAGRPSNIFFRMMNNRTGYWTQYSMMDWYHSEVSVLSTLILRAVTEIFRYGIEWQPKFKKKCTECGQEFQDDMTVCPYCGSLKLVSPDRRQQDYFVNPASGRSFLEDANRNHQSLKDVMVSFGLCQYQNNAGYIGVFTGDVTDPETGEIIKSYPLEFVAQDPKFVRFLYDDSAVPGALYGFTADNRHNIFDLHAETNEDGTANDIHQFGEYRGKTVYPAYYVIGTSWGGTGEYWAYTDREIISDNWFVPSLTYGRPIWFDMEDDMLSYHYIEKHTLKRFQFGYLRGIISLPGFSDEDADRVCQDIQDILAKNDNSTPIVALPAPIVGTQGEMEVKYTSLGGNEDNTLSFKDDIRKRLCAHGGVPDLLMGDVENSGGLNNETQQLTSFDRYLSDKYDHADTDLGRIADWFPKITDWVLRVKRPAKADQDMKAKMDQVQFASSMKNLGFAVLGYQNGEFIFSEKPTAAQGASAGSTRGFDRPAGGGQKAPVQMTDTEAERDETGQDTKVQGEGSLTKAASRQYLKRMSEEDFDRYLQKDAYGFLRSHRDEILGAMVIGSQVADVFRTCDSQQVRAIYNTIIESLQEPQWAIADIRQNVRAVNPALTEDEADRITRTEVGRILAYAKEQEALRTDGEDYLYVWTGPLDARTTPMCRYAQTGVLDPAYESLRPELPPWDKDGFGLADLKTFLHDIWQVFHNHGYLKTEMVSDWSMHINCRHTFRAVSQLPEKAVSPMPEDFGVYLNDDGTDAQQGMMAMFASAPRDDVDVISFEAPPEVASVAFLESEDGGPVIYSNGRSAGNTFVFATADERSAYGWAQFIAGAVRDGVMTPDDILEALLDSDLTDDEISYLMDNYRGLITAGDELGWAAY